MRWWKQPRSNWRDDFIGKCWLPRCDSLLLPFQNLINALVFLYLLSVFLRLLLLLMLLGLLNFYLKKKIEKELEEFFNILLNFSLVNFCWWCNATQNRKFRKWIRQQISERQFSIVCALGRVHDRTEIVIQRREGRSFLPTKMNVQPHCNESTLLLHAYTVPQTTLHSLGSEWRARTHTHSQVRVGFVKASDP